MSDDGASQTHTPVPVRWVTTASGIPGAERGDVPPVVPPSPPPRSRTRTPSWWQLAPATAALLALNVLVYSLEMAAGGSSNASVLLRLGAAARSLVLGGDWWRLMSCTVLHAGPLHLAANMFSLWSIGRVTERLIGTPRFLAVYCIGGIAASASGIAGSDATLVGASGAIVALLGPLVVFTIRMSQGSWMQRVTRFARQWAPTALMLALPGLLFPQVSNAAHIGGLIAGLLIGALVGIRPYPGEADRPGVRRVSLLAVIVMALGLAVGAVHALAGDRSVDLGGVRLTAPRGAVFHSLDGETAAYGKGFVTVHSRQLAAADAAAGDPLSASTAGLWIAEVLAADGGARATQPIWCRPVQASIAGRPAYTYRTDKVGADGGAADVCIVRGRTRAVLIEVLTPAAADLPPRAAAVLAEHAVVQ